MFVGSAPERDVPLDKYVSAIRAWDPLSGERKWEFRVKAKSTSGVLTTAGDVLFGGSVDGYFYALDAFTGKELFSINLGGGVQAAPVSYLVDGNQYVTIAAGGAIFTLGLK